MKPQDLDRAIYASASNADALREALKTADAVSAMILMPLIGQCANITNTLESLKSALRESQ